MRKAPWRRRRASDSPRPAGRGRRWTGRLRRSGVFARQVLRVRRTDSREVHSSRQTRLDPRTAATLAAIAADGAATAEPAAAAAPISLLPGAHTAARRARFALVNSCTLASLALGVLAILLAMRGDLQAAALCLGGCVVLDGLDGALARRLEVASPFGVQMDSLADMCAFGVAAPVVVYASLAGGDAPAPAAALTCALVAGCAAIRLARFNVSPKDCRYFTGVPTTMAAAMLALAVLLEPPLPTAVLLVGVTVLAFTMVASFPYATLAQLLRLPPWLWLAPLAGALLVDLRLTFVGLVAAYLASGPVLWFHRRGRRVVG